MGRREAYGIKKSKVKKLITGKWTNLEVSFQHIKQICMIGDSASFTISRVGELISKFRFNIIGNSTNLCETAIFTIRTCYKKKLGPQDLTNLLFKTMTHIFTSVNNILIESNLNKRLLRVYKSV